MKKYCILVICFVFSIMLNVSAADDAWIPADLSAKGEKMECSVKGPLGPNPQLAEIIPPISEMDWVLGPEDAALTILEYADFECPYCSNAGIALYQFQQKYPDQVRYVYRHFPLSFHEKAYPAAYAADAAGAQDNALFFEVEKYLYMNQQEWSALATNADFENWMNEKFKTEIPGLDFEQWATQYEDETMRKAIEAEVKMTESYGVIPGTPTVFLNLNFYQGGLDEAALKSYLDLFSMQKRVKSECPDFVIDPSKTYRATLETTQGILTLDLFADYAPLAVNSFAALVATGWYDGVSFHRIVPGFVAQFGDPSGTGLGGPGYTFANENSDLSYGEAGWLGMANSGVDKNGSQIFITYNLRDYYIKMLQDTNESQSAEKKLTDEQILSSAEEKLQTMNVAYPIFGKLTADSLALIEKLTPADKILTVTIEEKSK